MLDILNECPRQKASRTCYYHPQPPASPVSAVFCSRCGCAVRGNDFKLKTTSCTSGCTSASQTGHVLAVGIAHLVPAAVCRAERKESCSAASRGSLGGEGKGPHHSHPARCTRGKSACQPLLCCLLKSKYPRDSRMSMICTVFIQRDFATTQGNSYLIHLQPSDLILLIKCYC